MKLLALPFIYLLTTLSAEASAIHDLHGLTARHAQLSRRTTTLEERSIHIRAPPIKRCIRKSKNGTSTAVKAANTAPAGAKLVAPQPAPAPAPAPPPPPPSGGEGLIKVDDPRCGPNGATKDVTPVSGPNGHMNWLNCGFESGGWNPPNVHIQDLITVSLSEAMQKPNTPFSNCKEYVWMFEKHGNENGIPPIMLASFAMQESSCQPWKIGKAGEQGMMQITKEKCGGAPGGNCLDPDFNIGQGARFFKETLDRSGGNVILAVGTYNGWQIGLTPGSAFAAAYTGCCGCQNNGDYHQTFFNGWLLSVNPDGYNGNRLGKYFNLDKCS